MSEHLDSDAAAWVARADAAWAATHNTYRAQNPSPWDLDDDLSAHDAAEEFPAPFGPAVPGTGPVVLLDVDGVLSPFSAPKRRHWKRWARIPGYNTDQVSLDMAAALRRVPADVVWLTTWNDLAVTHVAPTAGLGTYPVMDSKHGMKFGGSSVSGWTKLHAVRCWLRTYGPRPLIWIDDDLNTYPEVTEDPYLAALPHFLPVVPNRRTGLTPDEIETVRAFAAEHTA